MSMELELDPRTTAAVIVDLQNATVGRELAPYSGDEVVERSLQIADALRAAGGLVVFTTVNLHELIRPPADKFVVRDPNAAIPEGANEFVERVKLQPGDKHVIKRQWGAFYGTDLDLQLRRRGIKTVIMTGLATNMGVESTARGAYDRVFELVFAHDAMSGLNGEMHEFSVTQMFPVMGKVRDTSTIVAALQREG